MIRIAMSLALAAALVSACGSTPSVVPTPHPGFRFDVLVTENDHVVTVHTDQTIELVLHAKPGMSDWSGVSVDDPAVLRAVPTGIMAAKGVTIAGFQAIATGTAVIRATAVPLCSPGQACPALAMLFQVAVTVV